MEQEPTEGNPEDKPDNVESYDESSSDDSSYEHMLHPNQENANKKSMKSKRYYTGCAKYLHRFDELIMKPLFIYNYERNMQKKSKEFFNLFMNQGTQIE